MSTNHSRPSIPGAVWGLGIGALFVNLSSVMVRSIFPVFLKTVLGLGSGWIGTVEGIVEGISFLMKMLSGVYSDYLRKRKLIVILGYGFITISRPLFALAGSIPTVLFARFLDRLGNGIQASPRDALVGDFAPHEIRGACYGLRVSLATAGSFLGAMFAYGLMFFHNENYQLVFFLATIPAIIAMLILILFIKEPVKKMDSNEINKKGHHPIHFKDIRRLGKKYWTFMTIVAVFMIGQLGEPIMILHAHENFGLAGAHIPTVLMTFNSTYSLVSYPAGRLSDRIGRHNTLIIGFLCLIAGDIALAGAETLWVVFLGIAFCGAQMAITQSIFMSLVADSVPADLRGTGFGMYYLICAICAFISNSVGGHLSEWYGQEVAFLASMGVASLALALLYFVKPQSKRAY